MTEKRVRSIVLPARSALDSDLALRLVALISLEPVSGGLSNGPGSMKSRWLEVCDDLSELTDVGCGETPLIRVNEADADMMAAMNFARRLAALTLLVVGTFCARRNNSTIKALRGGWSNVEPPTRTPQKAGKRCIPTACRTTLYS
jgi:hypothetical protein